MLLYLMLFLSPQQADVAKLQPVQVSAMLVLLVASGMHTTGASDACSCIQAASSLTYATSSPSPVTGLTLCTFLESDLKSD